MAKRKGALRRDGSRQRYPFHGCTLYRTSTDFGAGRQHRCHSWQTQAIVRTIRVGVLGATGAVGQRLVAMLELHPWFRLAEVVASDRSAGRPYSAAADWRLESPLPEAARELVVKDLDDELECDLLLSALDSSVAGAAEEMYARAGFPVISNSRNHRMDEDVPLLIPEVNWEHSAAIPGQRQRRGFGAGFMVTNPNCSTIGLVMALKPLQDAFGVAAVQVVTMQAISGAGLDGVSAGAIQDNVIPYIGGEEEKLEAEPLKILGAFDGSGFVAAEMTVSAQCNRVPVLDGHTESVSVRLARPASQGRWRTPSAASPPSRNGSVCQAPHPGPSSSVPNLTDRSLGWTATPARAWRWWSVGYAPARCRTGSSPCSPTTWCAEQPARLS